MPVGHVFVVKGDIRTLACDAWILPTDGAQSITKSWVEDWPRNFRLPDRPAVPTSWTTGSLRAWPDWPKDRSPAWLGAVGTAFEEPSWPAQCAGRWLDEVAASLRGKPPRHGRSKPLVALPLLGTGAGGFRARAGTVLKALLPVLRERAHALDIDVALVTKEPEAFSAAREEARKDPLWWADMPTDGFPAARALAERAGRGELVLFLGAGASAGAGLPDWNGLLGELAREARLDPEKPGWKRLSVLDQASLLQSRLRSERLTAFIAERFTAPEAALQHLLLASLPVSEIITTNYDDLFEMACRPDIVNVLPHDPRPGAGRWLLKMHGCVQKPEDIVLTRADYLRYEQRRASLAGIVQAMLLTRHMLFVGFSLNDENFHKVADAVRRARGSTASAPSAFGTVLKLGREELIEELWGRDLEFVPMGTELPEGLTDRERWAVHAERGRTLEIFLDYVLAHAPLDPAHFLENRFRGALSDGEKAFRDRLLAFVKELPTEAKVGSAWEHFSEALRRMGGS